MLMRINRRRLLFLAAGGAAVALPSAIAQSFRQTSLSKADPKASFQIYDSLVYKQRPSLNLLPIRTNGGEYWKNNDRTKPDEAACRNFARNLKDTGRVIVDIEHWDYDIRKASESNVRETMNKVIQIVDWMKDEVPQLEIGLYPFPPVTDYWTPVTNPIGIGDWKKANDFLRPVAEHVDFIAPEIYTYFDDRTNWLKFAQASLAEAVRIGKRTMPIVWPRYHVSNDKLKYQMLPGDFWQLQLKTVRESGVDGLILWDWEPETALNPTWGWWKETVKFVQVNA